MESPIKENNNNNNNDNKKTNSHMELLTYTQNLTTERERACRQRAGQSDTGNT